MVLFRSLITGARSVVFVLRSSTLPLHVRFYSQPDGVARNLIGEIISRFEKKGLKLVALKMERPSKEHLEKHYEDLKVRRDLRGMDVLAHFALKAGIFERLLAPSSIRLQARSFFPDLIKYMMSGPVVCMVWEGKNAFAVGRQMLGATKPFDSAPGTIRFGMSRALRPLVATLPILCDLHSCHTCLSLYPTADFAVDVGRNLCHGSDSTESAQKEIKLWFPEGVCKWTSPVSSWVFE